MTVRLAGSEDAARWDSFLAASPHGSFMQTWAWGEFLEATGQKIWRTLVEDGQHIRAVALVAERPVRLNIRWLYVPRGPVWDGVDGAVFASWQDFVGGLACERGAMFVRIDPFIRQGEPGVDFASVGWREADHQVQPQDTLLLDIQPAAEVLLATMHAKHRYNIRLAERKEVTVRFSREPKDVEYFLQLSREVAGRSAFRYHPDSYYRSLLATLGAKGVAELAVAEHKGKPLAAHMMVYSGKMATYLHGASSRVNRELMASHLLYWKAIERAKEKGCTTFDFYGVAPEGAAPDHPWSGVTKMKRGFGGKIISYIPARDLPIKPWLYKVFSWVRAVIRRG